MKLSEWMISLEFSKKMEHGVRLNHCEVVELIDMLKELQIHRGEIQVFSENLETRMDGVLTQLKEELEHTDDEQPDWNYDDFYHERNSGKANGLHIAIDLINEAMRKEGNDDNQE